MSTLLPFVFALYPLGLSGIALVWLYRSTTQTRLNWATHALACGSIVVFVFMTGPWAFTSYYLRYAMLGLYVFVAVSSHRRVKRIERHAAAPKARQPVFSALILILFSVLNIFAIGSQYESGETLDLSFPLTNGAYYVLQGGGNVVTNPFHALSGSKFAVDVTKLNILGNRADGIAPRDLNAYEIFGETLHSPCSGNVLTVRNGLPDNTPGEIDPERPEGNYIVLECADVRVLMAHLMQGSIRVTPGETVTTGQPVGKIGNSGNTLEPHLHIGAKKGEAENPLRFNGRWLSINSVVHGAATLPNNTLNRIRATTAGAGRIVTAP